VIPTLIFLPISVDFLIVKNYLRKCWGDSNPNILTNLGANPNILTNLGGFFHCLKMTWASVEVILTLISAPISGQILSLLKII
jgi:hypothetical protein